MNRKIGNLTLDSRVILAPMAGVTDRSFRTLCRRFGAAYVVTEMVSARALQFRDKKTARLMTLGEEERPTGIQLFGDDPAIMAQAAEKAMKFNPQLIDINMGCPAPKIANNGSGSALMKDPEKCGRMVEAVKNACNVPVTVKIRKGWDRDHVNFLEVAKICEQAGADAIALHARTRDQMYQPSADWNSIRELKQAVSVPVIGNGDVTDAQSACRMLEETGCDFLMVGRGAMGNPWIFQQINVYLTESCRILPGPGIAERLVVMVKHIRALCEEKGENVGMREARKHVAWYLHGLRGAAGFRRRAGELSTLDDLDKLVEEVYRRYRDEENREDA